MIERFLRWPQTASAVLSDVLRVVGLVSVLVAAVFFQATDAGLLAFVLPALLLPRFIGVPAGFDIAYCVVLLVAAWSNVFDLYTTVRWWDIPVHFCCTGVIAVLVYLLLARVGMVRPLGTGPRAATAVLTALAGLAVSALWEMVEWFGHAVISSTIFVEYNDTIGDMAVGGLGALTAGVVLEVTTASGTSGTQADSGIRADRA